jgi:transposase
VLHNDDTTVKILELMRERARREALAGAAVDGGGDDERNGLFTSGVVALRDGHRVALFFSGRRHAGENLAEVLKHRAEELPPPIQMCDALSRNLPGELQTILANCLAHARRRFVDVYDRFPEVCAHLLESLAVVYRNDAEARERALSPEARLRFHQEASGQTMEQLHDWLKRQLDEKRTEPNSALGEAIGYMLKHWEKLTLFLRQAGAPLDNNVCERALKKAILHRKNALFYKTQNGASVGDLFMSLIYTCQLNGGNPFDYLTELQLHAEALAACPERWMPWNYRDALA